MTIEGDHTIAVLKTATGALLSKLKVGIRLPDIVFTKDGKKTFVSNESDASVTLIDVFG
jgi:DNA-binding beta-propeller fold protein YncE